ncbi:DEAD box ATP-dependent RNA helicase, putative, partial [Entamoeba invadens IP1]|uniref:DEAD box ATP-dependent RNA helicase, putative n=1 Tax=Entamoeba invadens IP1 TaxID=370355 RepID=UPI0002C3EE37
MSDEELTYIPKTEREKPSPPPKREKSFESLPSKVPMTSKDFNNTLTKEEQAEIIQQYRGGIKPLKKLQKPSEKFKIPSLRELLTVKPEDDTTNDPNEMYNTPISYTPLFGRGTFGGDFVGHMPKSKKSSRSSTHTDNEMNIITKSLEEMTENDWRIVRENISLSVSGGEVVRPLRKWSDVTFLPEIQATLSKLNYSEPTPVQAATIPIALNMRDIIGLAETGTGKTAAYVIPLVSFISKLPRLTRETACRGPYGLVLAPTRELAKQIDDEIKKFSEGLKIRVLCCIGGEEIDEQIKAIEEGVEVLVGAPGRIRDLLRQMYLVLGQCYYCVLDEADKMIDMGLDVQVREIFNEMPPLKSGSDEEMKRDELNSLNGKPEKRTTLMFSATMPANLEKLTGEYIRRGIKISVGRKGVADKVRQRVMWVEEEKKGVSLLKLVETIVGKVIVFANKKTSVDEVVAYLEEKKVKACGIHGGMRQDERTKALETFKKGNVTVLVATSVLSRGIDIESVDNVINYDSPNNFERLYTSCWSTREEP